MIEKHNILSAKILIIDDMRTNVMLMEKILQKEGYRNIYTTTDPKEAVEMYSVIHPDIVLLDLNMPHMDGFEVIKELKSIERKSYLPILVLTAKDDMGSRNKALQEGARDFLGKPFNKREVLNRIHNILEVKLLQKKIEVQNEDLERKIAQRTKELKKSELEIARRLAIVGEFRDNDTGNHIIRVGKYSEIVARILGMDGACTQILLHAAPLHDIGKVAIPDSILLKPGKLTEEEWEIMKSHADIGGRILSGGRSQLIRMAETIAYTHHEKYDGSGYPKGLKGEEIPIEGRIVAICDFFDAVTTPRPYKDAWSIDVAVNEMLKLKGSHFEPKLLEIFMKILPQIIRIKKAYE
ncbi:HD domain-containing phosphohydrolase [Clostridium formicaceticum]|uniref:Stage 0 sporulation protein A homolog n=1 Tax=Clostridium formicaceticum TaxID=1497 RepID=A0AAC9RMH7_9CLOT|nr:HD domain-containing phosphohydrolase [Clostridium formicaceticum]AOY78130.1 two-component system response regulator [Clostridium formicaceticum]ARE88781.1 Cyclic di-GMP phosphodiesterase response regulator RpfG [Clostridium formicaceticum]